LLLRIVRNLTSEEVEQKIKDFEKEFCMSFEKFEELFLNQKLDGKYSRVYFEWAELVDSYRGYIEEGTLDYTVEEVRDLTPKQVALLTPRRIELLFLIAALRVESINDLAQKARRNVKNVHQDLQVLSQLGFVRLSKQRGRALIPETLVKEITFSIR